MPEATSTPNISPTAQRGPPHARRLRRKANSRLGREYSPTSFCVPLDHPVRAAAIALVEWWPFDQFILALIIANSLLIAIVGPDGVCKHASRARVSVNACSHL